jgi:hypothetical protein
LSIKEKRHFISTYGAIEALMSHRLKLFWRWRGFLILQFEKIQHNTEATSFDRKISVFVANPSVPLRLSDDKSRIN